MEKPNLIPHFITAPNKKKLMEKMLRINLEANAFHKFFDIQKDGSEWICWYYKAVTI